jgi:hypothetical protein
MKDKRVWLALAVLLIVAAVLVKVIFFPVSENQRINNMLYEVAAALQDKSTSAVAEYLTDDFLAHPKRDKETVITYLKRFFFQVRDLKVEIELIKHEIDKLPKDAKKTRVIVIVKVTGTINKQKFQAFGGQGADTVVLEVEKIDGKWLISLLKYLDTSDPGRAFEQLFK